MGDILVVEVVEEHQELTHLAIQEAEEAAKKP